MGKKDVMVFDIGGTYIRYNILNEHLDLLEDISSNKYRSPSFHRHPNFSGDELVSALIDQITKSFENIKKRNGALNVGGIGISFPGPVNSKGTVRSAPPLWGDIIKNYPLKNKLESILPNKVFILNDVSASCWYYKSKFPDKRFCVITVSTGIGSKVFDMKHEDKIITLSNGLGGEIGHASIECEEPSLVCDCGYKSHLGAIASGRGTEKYAKRYCINNLEEFSSSLLKKMTNNDPQKIDSFKIVQAFKEGDQLAINIITNTSRPLALMIQQIYIAIGIEKFIIIGGFSFSLGEDYRKILINHIKDIGIWGLKNHKIDRLIVLGDEGDEINLKGIGKYVFSNL